MPASLRFVLLLSGIGMLATPIAIYVIERQDSDQTRVTAEQLTGGHVDAGKAMVARYACTACHEIPGTGDAAGKVGPSLAGIAVRTEIAGELANSPDAMIRWLRHPQQVSPGNGMPEQGVTDADARNIAAYLYTLKR
jgi:cytochrome c2